MANRYCRVWVEPSGILRGKWDGVRGTPGWRNEFSGDRTHASLADAGVRYYAGTASLTACHGLYEWFGVERCQATIQHRYQAYADYYEQGFTADPDRVAVDENVFNSKISRKRGFMPQSTWHGGRDPAERFLRESKEKHRVSDAEFPVDSMGYPTALARRFGWRTQPCRP